MRAPSPSHTRIDPSVEPEYVREPSLVTNRAFTDPVWPRIRRRERPAQNVVVVVVGVLMVQQVSSSVCRTRTAAGSGAR